MTQKLGSASDGVFWNVAFKEVANLDEKILEENVCDKTRKNTWIMQQGMIYHS